jgi:hypothetical protein
VKILLPNTFIVHDRELARICAPLAEIAGIAGIGRPYNAHASPYGIGGGSFWLKLGTEKEFQPAAETSA